MAEFGFFALLLGFVLSLYGLVFGAISLFRPHSGLTQSARNALIAVPFCIFTASLVVWDALLTHDFSVRYVYRNSAVDMPIAYLFSAFWSALEGSHMLWSLLVTVLSAIALVTVRERNKPLLPGLVFSFGIVQTFMTLLLVWASAPLTRLFPVGQYGAGMNALLQNPYMAAHPPTLFTGYSSLIVPFGYGLAALLKGGFTPEWLISVRRWALWGWAILTVGIFLGGKWAYVELGWAGYWAWDPVENASFMPWLAITAGLHTIIILDKLGRLPRLAVFLCTFPFILTFLGTFITRSGVISSVHSFAESNIGPAYLSFIVLLLMLSLSLLIFRGDKLQTAVGEQSWKLSKETTLLYTNFFLLFLLTIVAVGTLLPIIVEAIRGVKISIQQPFFNSFAPWIGLGLLLLIGVGNLLKWRSGKIEDPIASLGFPALWALIIVGVLTYQKKFDAKSAVGYYLIVWSTGVLIMDLIYRLRDLKWNGTLFLKYNRPYFGAWIVHVGFLLATAGFLGGFRGLEAQTTLEKGGTTEFYGLTIENQGLQFKQGSNANFVSAILKTRDQNGDEYFVEPMRSKFTNSEEWLNEIGVHSEFWRDLYIVLASFDHKTEQVTLKLHINPTVKFVWTSLVVMVIGALVSLSHRFIRRNLEVNAKGLELETSTLSIEDIISGRAVQLRPSRVGTAMSGVIIFFVVSLCAFGLSGSALANTENQNQQSGAVISLDPRLTEIGKELRCPTCQGISILESETPQSKAMKREIENQLAQGKQKDEIISFFKERYGEWILRKPDSGSFLGFWIWTIPFVGLIVGPIVLLVALKRTRLREIQERAEIRASIETYLAKRAQEGSSRV